MRILIATAVLLTALAVGAAPEAEAGTLNPLSGIDVAPDVYIGFGYDHHPRRRYVRRTYYPRRVSHTYRTYPTYSDNYAYPGYSHGYYSHRTYTPRYSYSRPSISLSYGHHYGSRYSRGHAHSSQRYSYRSRSHHSSRGHHRSRGGHRSRRSVGRRR